jgi:hypothetical protein
MTQVGIARRRRIPTSIGMLAWIATNHGTEKRGSRLRQTPSTALDAKATTNSAPIVAAVIG